MRLLLDTHLWLKVLSDSKHLGREAKTLIERADVYVSVASMWEISIKAALGKLKVKPADILKTVDPTGFTLLSVQGEHAVRVFELGSVHRDPFDRLLVAQAQLESMTLLTYDETLARYGNCVRVI
jgi:PIN domain nuclease of toxin-antitoxin system